MKAVLGINMSASDGSAMEPSAISATRRQMKEMADGTIRVQVDIDPAFRAAFLAMFPNIDMPIALAPLRASFEQPKAAPQTEPAKAAKARQTPSMWLAMRCQESRFWEFLEPMNLGFMPTNETDAARIVRDALQVASRAECDTDPGARARFDELRLQWIDWCAEND